MKAGEAAVASGERGALEALLRQEDIYSSHLSAWRQQLGTLGAAGLEPRQPGRKPKLGAKERQLAAATKALALSQRKLQVANAIIALQERAHEVLGLALPEPDAILATVATGCSPVRAAATADGKVLWVAARGDNRVLAFSTARLESNPDRALIGHARTGGTAPVGIALFHRDRLLAVANSNRFCPGQQGNAAILDATHPRRKRARVLKKIRTGLFPRNITVGPDDATLYPTNFSSNTLQVVSTTVR